MSAQIAMDEPTTRRGVVDFVLDGGAFNRRLSANQRFGN
jgi:hypothetical protein